MDNYTAKIVEGFEVLTALELAFSGWVKRTNLGDAYTKTIVHWECFKPMFLDTLEGGIQTSPERARLRRYVFSSEYPISCYRMMPPRNAGIVVQWNAGVTPVAKFFESIHKHLTPHDFDYVDPLDRTYGEAYLDKMASILWKWGYRDTKHVPRKRSVERKIKRGLFVEAGTNLGAF